MHTLQWKIMQSKALDIPISTDKQVVKHKRRKKVYLMGHNWMLLAHRQ